MSYESGTLEVYDMIGAETLDILMAWQAKAGNPLWQTVGLQQEYKTSARLVEYLPDYSKVVRTWVLDGCWVSNISEANLDVDAGNNARTITCTVEYDRAYVDWEANN